jgi:hypothetical protein
MPGRDALPTHAASLPDQGQERICAVPRHVLKHEVHAFSDELGFRDAHPTRKRLQLAILLLR